MFVAVYLIVPSFRATSSIFFGFYDQVGGSPMGVVRMVLPIRCSILSALDESHDIAYVVWLGLPLLFLFLLSPGLAAVATPELLVNGLSDFRSMTDPRYHSVAAVIPFLIAATVLGIARIGPPRRPLRPRRSPLLGAARYRCRAVAAGRRHGATRAAQTLLGCVTSARSPMRCD